MATNYNVQTEHFDGNPDVVRHHTKYIHKLCDSCVKGKVCNAQRFNLIIDCSHYKKDKK